MLGIPVLQVYGLTETTAICTMDDVHDFTPGRVGPAIPGIEMKLSENDEIVVRGPNVFPGYWNRPQQTAEVLRDGWFHSGDQGEMDASGNWRIVGRIKNLIVLGSGHRSRPKHRRRDRPYLPAVQQAVVSVEMAVDIFPSWSRGRDSRTGAGGARCGQSQLPHYKKVRAFRVLQEPFDRNGMLTPMQLKRDLISSRMKNEIEEMYRVKQGSRSANVRMELCWAKFKGQTLSWDLKDGIELASTASRSMRSAR
jgi:long-chain acyl-CoA synthetase